MSTEAAGEGWNPQFCRRIINYELPRSPTPIEGWVERIRRIGQTRAVDIFNHCAEVAVEDHMLRILDCMTSMFGFMIGEMDMTLGNPVMNAISTISPWTSGPDRGRPRR
jgi:hypothetical protein